MDVQTLFPQVRLAAVTRPVPGQRYWPLERDTILLLLSLSLPVAVAVFQTAGAIAPLLGGSLVVAIGVTALFALARGREMNWFCIVTAATFSLIVPPVTPLWQALLALGFGIVVAEQIFGGRGYGFLHPAVAALAFLFFSFPAAAWPVDLTLVAAAVIPGTILLLATGLISWRVLAGVAIGGLALLAVAAPGLSWGGLLTPTLAVGVVFLVCDPVSAASTNAGRWLYGLLVGALVIILGSSGDGIASPATIVFAALLGSIFAPLIDRVVILLNVQRRRRRLG